MSSITTLVADAIARPVGQSPVRIDKRPGDERPYLIDLAPLLGEHELAVSVASVEAAGLRWSASRTRLGRYVEVTIGGGEVADGRPHQDHALTATLTTTRGALQVAIDVRVHAR